MNTCIAEIRRIGKATAAVLVFIGISPLLPIVLLAKFLDENSSKQDLPAQEQQTPAAKLAFDEIEIASGSL